ncbi:MAG TPA: M15 family metallopeptidase [Jatrophihabitans sp.]|nr:M15 family metallopeptidase [Jatrophihabitans sp.]
MNRRLAAGVLALACAGCGAGHPSVSQPTVLSSVSASSSTPIVSVPAPSTTPSSPATISHSATPSRTVATAVPPVSAAARAAGLLDVRTVVPDAIVDLRYATSHNFVGAPLYPADARCLVHQSMAAGLATAAIALRRQGDLLVFWDCYRPHSVQVRMFQIVPNPDWVARPGPDARSHEAARSVDVTLARAATGATCSTDQRVQGHCLLDMGTGFDDFTPRAYAFASKGVSALAQANRSRLRLAMNAGGLAVYSGEWWHFDGPGALVGRPFLNVAVD